VNCVKLEELGAGVMGNNRYDAVISDQIEIMMVAAMETIARREAKDVEGDKNDMRSFIHNLSKQSQVAEFMLNRMGKTVAFITKSHQQRRSSIETMR
jgi:hypothetical protein